LRSIFIFLTKKSKIPGKRLKKVVKILAVQKWGPLDKKGDKIKEISVNE